MKVILDKDLETLYCIHVYLMSVFSISMFAAFILTLWADIYSHYCYDN